ncbi:MAG TPA: AAA family ATPase [Terriglobales bacterium]|nr:AAA family ATPase [Terriglobales bacterium]
MTRGLVIGKFYPPHRGHKFLIEMALSQVEHLDVLICVRPEQNISGQLREQWLKEIHPSAHVRQIEDFGDDDNSERWAAYTISILGYVPDVVFTSEDYGEPYARFMGCRHVSVDRQRLQVPVSARAIRGAPLRYWEFLEPCVRAYYAKRVCVVGAESTGTTTLVQDLAAHYQTVWVPEYGREYCEKMQAAGVDIWNYQWRSEEFVEIAVAQQKQEDHLAREANRVLFCDTDALATSIWHERYLGSKSTQVERIASARHYDFYFLTDCDIPFVQDGLREGENIRRWMTDRFVEKLNFIDVAWQKLSGSRERRLESAVQIVDALVSKS